MTVCPDPQRNRWPAPFARQRLMTDTVIRIRLARPGDRAALIEVMRRASLAVETGEVLRRLIEESEHIDIDDRLIAFGQVVLAESAGVPVAFASYLVEDGQAELDGMFVDPEHWRRGLGRSIFAALKQELANRGVHSLRVVAGPAALDFYRAVGLAIVGEQTTPLGPTVPVMRIAIP